MKQIEFTLPRFKQGFHIITDIVIANIGQLPKTGLLHLFLKHTSAGICINENADPSVLHDLNEWFNRNIKENEPYYLHIYEGQDDMPAHIKSILTSCEITIPISGGKLNLGTWQGIYLAEFRMRASERTIVATIME